MINFDKIFNALKQIIFQLFGAVLIIIGNVVAVILAGVGVILVLIILEPILKPFILFLKFLLCS